MFNNIKKILIKFKFENKTENQIKFKLGNEILI